MLLSAVGLLAVSCAEIKTSQCRQIVEITRNIADKAQVLSNSGQTQDPQQVLQVADAFEEAAQEMKAIPLQDEQLVEYQSGYAQLYLGYSQATRHFIAALGEKEIEVLKQSQQELQRLGQKERQLGNAINDYCQQP
ncbi:MAG: hypothetical protein HC890_17595 [Chloroflexaceae bacterium]|nr:hypothetical protein [Chloroflexaceae bacterium]